MRGKVKSIISLLSLFFLIFACEPVDDEDFGFAAGMVIGGLGG